MDSHQIDLLEGWNPREPAPIELPVSFDRLSLVPITLKMANNLVSKNHRHSGRTARDGGKWAVGAALQTHLVGCAIVGRPVARLLADVFTAEVLRLCVVPDAPPNTPSMLYGACWRGWRAMGGKKMITYTLQTESGRTLHAAGWVKAADCKPSSWNWRGRPRKHQDIYSLPKTRWEVTCL